LVQEFINFLTQPLEETYVQYLLRNNQSLYKLPRYHLNIR